MAEFLDIIFSGDLVLDEPEPEYWLSGIAPALRKADLAVGHLEVPHTRRGCELKGDVPAPGADPDHLAALLEAGFGALTMAGNHMADCGEEGIIDTREELNRLGIAYCGAGVEFKEACRPAVLYVAERRISILSYNCVGPEEGWAAEGKAGVAYVRVDTADGGPIAPSAPLERVSPDSKCSMQRDIISAKQDSDILVVALHKGIVHTPAVLAPYEQPAAYAAIDAGADVVIGHHAHIIRGIEFYRGKPIFHGLGNGCVVTRALNPGQDHPLRAEWALRRKELFGFEPDPEYWLAPFHPQAVNSMLGRVRWYSNGSFETGFIPVYVEPPGRPVLADRVKAEEITGYVADINVKAGLPPLTMNNQKHMVVVS